MERSFGCRWATRIQSVTIIAYFINWCRVTRRAARMVTIYFVSIRYVISPLFAVRVVNVSTCLCVRMWRWSGQMANGGVELSVKFQTQSKRAGLSNCLHSDTRHQITLCHMTRNEHNRTPHIPFYATRCHASIPWTHLCEQATQYSAYLNYISH